MSKSGLEEIETTGKILGDEEKEETPEKAEIE